MANAWHVHFDPTIALLTPQQGGTFGAITSAPGAKVRPTPGSFPVVTSVQIRITDDASGPPPLQPGAAALPATLELIGRARPATSGPGGTPGFVSLGVFQGTAGYDTSGATPVPQFQGSSRKSGSGVSSVVDFTAATDPLVANSDWIMFIDPHAPDFTLSRAGSFPVQLPWSFIENPGRLQLSARLTVGGTLHADESRNTPVDIPLKHEKVPEAADQGTPLTFFGVRNLYTRSNDKTPNPNVAFVPANNQSLDIIMHRSLARFCAQNTSTTAAAVLAEAANIMGDAGFTVVNTVSGPNADALCAQHWKQVGGHFIGIKISEPAASGLAAAIDANIPATVPPSEIEILPFFEFYVFGETVEPPNPNELAHQEILMPMTGASEGVFATQARKAVVAPIVIALGQNPSTPLRSQLAAIAPSDHVNLLASTICHEIGHTFGLRHSVAFTGAPPYQTGDTRFSRGVMSAAGILTGLGTPPFPPQRFGPVHVLAIKKLFSL